MGDLSIKGRGEWRLTVPGLRVFDPVGRVRVVSGDIEYEYIGRNGDDLVMRPADIQPSTL